MFQYTNLILAIVCVGALVAAAGGVAAQEVPEHNETDTPGAQEATEQLGDLKIHSYDYDGEVMTIRATWEGRGTTQVTMTELIELDSEGSTEISFQRVRLRPDTTTELTIPVEGRSNGVAAVLLTTPESTEEGNGLVLQDGSPGGSDPVPFNATIALVSIAGIGGAAAVFGYVRKKRDDGDPERRERIA